MKKMKFILKITLIAATILLLSEACIFAATGKAKVSSLRVRKKATTDSAVLETLAAGDTVEILAEEGSWYKVKAKGVTGYVSKQYLDTGDNSSNVQEEPKSNDEQQNKEENKVEENKTEEKKEEQQPVEEEKKEEPANNEQENKVEEEKKQVITKKIYKTSENASVCILPVITSDTIGEIKKNEEVNVISTAGLWAYVKTNNISGWIKLDKLLNEEITETVSNTENNNQKQEEKIETNNQNTNTNTSFEKKTMYVKGTTVNVREKADKNSNIVCAVFINETINVVGQENNWYKIEYKGKKGYIRSDLLSDKKVETASRDTVERKTLVNEIPSTANEKAESVPVSSSGVTGNDIVEYAKQFKGYSYVYGAAGPNAFDCSGFTSYVYNHFGYKLNRTSRDQAKNGTAVTGALQPGDILVFTNSSGSAIGHVGIYMGNDKFIHASDSTTGVIISNLSDKCNKSKYVGARRII